MKCFKIGMFQNTVGRISVPCDKISQLHRKAPIKSERYFSKIKSRCEVNLALLII